MISLNFSKSLISDNHTIDREIYRLNKHIRLVSNSFKNIQIAFSISFVGKIKLDSKQLEVSLVKTLKLIVQHVEKINPIPISTIH